MQIEIHGETKVCAGGGGSMYDWEGPGASLW
jgi:hypothetical protein